MCDFALVFICVSAHMKNTERITFFFLLVDVAVVVVVVYFLNTVRGVKCNNAVQRKIWMSCTKSTPARHCVLVSEGKCWNAAATATAHVSIVVARLLDKTIITFNHNTSKRVWTYVCICMWRCVCVFISLPAWLRVGLSACLLVCLPDCLSACLPAYLPGCLFACIL